MNLNKIVQLSNSASNLNEHERIKIKEKVAEIEKNKIWKFLANCSSEDLTEIKKALKK